MKKAIIYITLFVILFTTSCNLDKAEEKYLLANKYMENKEYQEALSYYEEAIQLNKDRAEYYIAEGFAKIGLSRYDEAINSFDKAYLDKDNQIVRENNKKLFRGRGIALLRLLRYEEAIGDFKKALAIKEVVELDSDIKRYLALTDVKLGRYEEALEIYEEMLSSGKKIDGIYNDMAVVYKQLGNVEKAIESYNLQLKEKPNDFTTYFSQYELYSENGREDEAKEVLQVAAGIKLNTDEDLYFAGVLEYLRGNYKESEEYLNLAYSKNIYETTYYLARIALGEGDVDRAKMYFEKYKIENKEIPISGWYDGMAECEIIKGNYESALEYVSKGLSLPDISFTKEFLIKKIKLYEKLAEYDRAYEAAKDYLKLYKDDEKIKREFEFLATRL